MKHYFIIYLFLLISCKECVIVNNKKPEKSKTAKDIEKEKEEKEEKEETKKLNNLDSLDDFAKHFADFDSIFALVQSVPDFSDEQKKLFTQAVKKFAYEDMNKAQNFLASVGQAVVSFDEKEELTETKKYVLNLMNNMLDDINMDMRSGINSEVKKKIFDITDLHKLNRIMQAILYDEETRRSIMRLLNNNDFEVFNNILNINIIKNLHPTDINKSQKQGLAAAFLILKTLQKQPVFITYPQHINNILYAALYIDSLMERVLELCERYKDEKNFIEQLKNSDLLKKYENLNLDQEQLEFVGKIKNIVNEA